MFAIQHVKTGQLVTVDTLGGRITPEAGSFSSYGSARAARTAMEVAAANPKLPGLCATSPTSWEYAHNHFRLVTVRYVAVVTVYTEEPTE